MTTAKAKHCVNYNGQWHKTGETFSIDPKDAEEMKQYAEIIEENVSKKADDTGEESQTETVKRGRKRKTEE